MNYKFVVASNNKDKVREFKEILQGYRLDVLTPKDLGIYVDPDEDSDTFEGNAYIKAKAVFDLTNTFVVADDSGLVIKALDGVLGVKSSRFCGEGTDYDFKIRKIWELLEQSGSKDRSAKFVSAICLFMPSGENFTVRGECHGIIHDRMEGENGFGYDPVFYMPEYKMTTASMEPSLKNQISHRGIALKKMMEILQNNSEFLSLTK